MNKPVRLLILFLLAIFGLGSAGRADDLPKAPTPQPAHPTSHTPLYGSGVERPRLWTPQNMVLIASDALAKSYDMWNTMRNASRPKFEEHDPLARPFVHSGPALAGASQGALFAVELLASYKLLKRGHPALAKGILMLGIGGNALGAATSSH